MPNIAVMFKKSTSEEDIDRLMRKYGLSYKYMLRELKVIRIIAPKGKAVYWVNKLNKHKLVKMAEIEEQLRPH